MPLYPTTMTNKEIIIHVVSQDKDDADRSQGIIKEIEEGKHIF